MTVYLTYNQVKRALLAAASDLTEREEELCRLDSYVGDGDHGITVRKAFQQLINEITAGNPDDFSSLFMTASMAMMNTAGGAIGPILSSMFAGFSSSVRGKETLTTDDLASMFESGMISVQEIGGARPGERTMLDALCPAVKALQSEDCPEHVPDALALAAKAAAEGAAATAGMIGVRGRAKNLAERSLGYVDAGATTIAYFIRAFSDSVRTSEDKLLMSFRYYVPTDIRFGAGAVSQLPGIAAQYGSSALLVAGIPHNAAYEEVTGVLDSAGIVWHEISGVDPNPRITTVELGASLCREKEIDMVIALGGGSTIDCAKGIAAAACCDGPAWNIILDPSRLTRALPVLAIPTMSAAGSEMGNAAVLTNPETNEKLLLASDLLFPKVSFLDPRFVFTLPRRQTAAGTADIFIHTLEEYFDSGTDAYLTDGICEAVFRTCLKYGRRAMDVPDDYEARANLMWAAPLAINGLLNCGRRDGWSLHNTQHPLGGFYDVTHGEALAVLTPHWMRRILSEKTVDRFVLYGVNVFGIDSSLKPFEIAGAAIQKTEDFFFTQLELRRTLGEMGVDDSRLEQMAEMALIKMGKMYVPFSKEELTELYRECL